MAGPRFVTVAVDAPGGAGARAWTYHVPEHLADLEPGEAVLVDYGRRQALGVILAEAEAPDRETRPIADRVRADGPLLPGLSLRLASWISAHYLAPPAMVVRAMLPPGLLERLELVAELRPDVAGEMRDLPVPDRTIVEALSGGPRPIRDLAAPEGRAGLVRRVRALAADGILELAWTLLAASAGPRYERWVMLTPEGQAVATTIHDGGRPEGRALGARQRSALAELGDGPTHGVATAGLGDRHGSGVVAGLVRRGLAAVETRERPRQPLASRPAGRRGGRPRGSVLTPPQEQAVALVAQAIADRDSTPLLLDGVTGGGKTAVYVEAVAASLDAGRPTLLLVPEISLALPLIDRLRSDLSATVAVLHSGLGQGERLDEWRRIRSGAVDIVVGTRLAVLAPLGDVGLIVVDEEHDGAYKSDRTPRIQARDAAVQLAALAGAAVVLGSATPAVDSVGRARAGTIRRLALPTRPSGSEPAITIVDLRAELAAGNRGLLSAALAAAIAGLDTTTGDQAILLINRRGAASVVLCRDCGSVQACSDCERPLVYHQAGATLRCHHCGRATPLATRCPQCGSARIRYLGGGTERTEREVRAAFPQLRVARLDRDVAERKGAADRVLDAFAGGAVDVLVGTSLVAKGLDIPGVVLVGVVSADVALNLPDERAAERTYQLIAQAVGRAGRGDRRGRAIVQTYQPDHPAIRAVGEADPDTFYSSELELRRRFGSPPYGSLVKLTVGLPDRVAAEREAHEMALRLRDRAAERGVEVAVMGPAPAFIARRGDRWRWNLVLRGSEPVPLLDGGLESPWTVDVDPESLL
ncbi:MAG: primosomal protein N' [Chloroflexota bacterium]